MKCGCGCTKFKKYEEIKIKREFLEEVDLKDVSIGEGYYADPTLVETVETREIFECVKCRKRYYSISQEKYKEPSLGEKVLFFLGQLKEEN